MGEPLLSLSCLSDFCRRRKARQGGRGRWVRRVRRQGRGRGGGVRQVRRQGRGRLHRGRG